MREWLEQQAVAGFLSVDDPDAHAGERRYRLPAAHRAVLVDEENLNLLTPLATLAIGVCAPMEALLQAYRSGGGCRSRRTAFTTRSARSTGRSSATSWRAGSPRSRRWTRLRAQPRARVADIACGTAWSSIAIARAYPEVTVDALDVDAESIETAHRNVAASGLADRVKPAVHDASDPELGGGYDLVTIFEALHDMNHPVEALRAARNSLTEGGSVLIADERVAERFFVPGDEIERFNYGWSVLHCLAVGLLDEDSAGTGTVIRPETVGAYAGEAGFGRIEVLPIEHDFWRFYRLVPWARRSHEGEASVVETTTEATVPLRTPRQRP